ncbi:MAG: hypothetical protein M3Z23_04265 [Acidobacteriota bacterium]|nr:hypothetical protein [Acidobacteriota bacterium]
MIRYKLCDSTVGSNVLLPELPESEGTPEWIFELLERDSVAPDCKWFHQWDLPDGRVWLYFGRQGSDYLLRFPGLADFSVLDDAKSIRCFRSPDTPLDTIRHLFLDQVLPLVLSRCGRLVLHASAVAGPRGAIAFLGRTGYGKSTLAGAFSQTGFPMVTDDCLLIEEAAGQIWGVPSYPGLRLWPETVSELFGGEPTLSKVAHYSRKKRVGAREALPFRGERIGLSRIYVLGDPDETTDSGVPFIAPLSPRDAFMELVQFAFLMDITDRAALSEKFQAIGRTAALPIFRRLSYPHEFSLLHSVRAAILRDIMSDVKESL